MREKDIYEKTLRLYNTVNKLANSSESVAHLAVPMK